MAKPKKTAVTPPVAAPVVTPEGPTPDPAARGEHPRGDVDAGGLTFPAHVG